MAVVIGRGITLFSVDTASGTLNAADNGLSVSGGNTVELGGALIKPTSVNVNGQILTWSALNSGTGSQARVLLTDDDLISEYTDDNGNVAFFEVNNAFAAANAGMAVDYTATVGGKQQIYMGTGLPVNGIYVLDTLFNVGLIGSALFANSDPKQYAQYGNIGSNLVGSINDLNQSALNYSKTLYTVNATKNQLLRVNPAYFPSSLGSTTNITYALTYTDRGGNVRTVTLATITSLNTPTIPAQVIYAEKNTNVILTVTLNISGAIYDIYATCEYLGVQN